MKKLMIFTLLLLWKRDEPLQPSNLVEAQISQFQQQQSLSSKKRDFRENNAVKFFQKRAGT